MATNPTNSSVVSILNLPQASLATPTDFLILQTTNGTQIIPFSNFNVVQTDINGNATIVGNLTGTNAIFNGGVNTLALTASNYYSQYGQPGISQSYGYYDSFTIANGLIVSATQTGTDYANNPIYTTLNAQFTALSANVSTQLQTVSSTLNSSITSLSATTQTQIQSLTASLNSSITSLSATTQTQIQSLTASYQTQLYTLTAYSTGVYDSTVTNKTLPMANGLSGINVSFTGFFNPLPAGTSVIPSNFIISPNATSTNAVTAFYSASPFIDPNSITQNNTTISVVVSAANPIAFTGGIPFNLRFFFTYNAQAR